MHKSLQDRMNKEGYSKLGIDLFSGPGGLCTGFKWGGILPLIAVEWTDTTVKTYSLSHNAEVFELNKYIVDNKKNQAYFDSFAHESTQTLLIHGDINLVDSEMIKELLLARYGIDSQKETIDIVSGGAPCESFSMAGKRIAGDERDDLFSNILRISRTVNSKMVLFENVKGIFSKPKNGVKGAIFEYICDSFEDKNAFPSYNLVSRDQDEVLLKACNYGVPQVRERLFLVAIRSDLKDIKFSYPEKEYGPGRKYPYVTVKDALSDLPYVTSGEESVSYHSLKKYDNNNQKRFVSIVRGEGFDNKINAKIPQHLLNNGKYSDSSISGHKGPGHVKRKQELLALIPEKETMKTTYDKLTKDGKIAEYRHLFPRVIYASRNRRLIDEEPSFTVTSHCLDEILHPSINRAITPREAARLQSFPDWYQFEGPYVQFHGSKEQDKYEQIGDAIPPLLAYALAKEIVKTLKDVK